jgi:hypothetical protein
LSFDPVVSVVLPVWNGERFLAEAVESVLSQTLDSFELLLVDDGSTDATSDIAHVFTCRDPRVRVIHIDRRGIAHALNAGIEQARGRYVARMDADDISCPSRLQKQIAYLDANPDCVAVGSAVSVIDEAGEHVGTRTFPEHHDGITNKLISGWSNAIAHPTVVMRREALLAVGGYRPDRVPSEDLDLWIRLSAIGKLANVNDQLLRYRRHTETVGLRDSDQQCAVGTVIVNEERQKKGLRLLAAPTPAVPRSRRARYHFECARTALLTGSRWTALRHTRATIKSEPRWLQPYMALLACVIPQWTVRLLHGASSLVTSMTRF